MKNIFTQSKLVWGVAVLFWVVVFIISSIFINPETHTPYINNYIFHAILFAISIVFLYFIFKSFQKKNIFNTSTIYTFLFVNILLDWVVLIGLINFPISEWFILVLPAYLIGTILVYKIIKK